MTKEVEQKESGSVKGIYQECEAWEINTGDKTIHAKRMPGFFRSIKNYTQALWLLFFLVPYLRWGDKQAILFDINNRQFHFFGITVLPQDIWMLALLMLLAAMVMFAVTSVASRVWCGFFCFQTAWTDWFAWIENKIEGTPHARRKLESAPWSVSKIKKKVIKHSAWMLISLITGVSFSIWFVDAYDYWGWLLSFDLPLVGWVTLISFFFGTYLLAGMLREQTCMWMCPYSRIQGVMSDNQTVLPTYDYMRGEPRGKLAKKKNDAAPPQGDCIDCYQCVQVCPTGVDIRQGQQLGCITCGLCLDACDAIMDKIEKPRGLIRYASLDEIEGRPTKKIYQHPRTWAYIVIMLLSLGGIVYGLTHLGSLTLRVLPERQPLYVQLSDGSIRNQYEVKVLNKLDDEIEFRIRLEQGVEGQEILNPIPTYKAKAKKGSSYTVFIKAPKQNIKKDVTAITFIVENIKDNKINARYETKFSAPAP